MMKEKIRTLLIDANGLTWKAVATDTLFKGLLGINLEPPLPHWLRRNRFIRRRLWFRNESLSYVVDWREAFCENAELKVDVCNLSNLIEYYRCLRRIDQYPLIIILHAATGDRMSLLLKGVDALNRRRGKLVVFVGNEYNLLGEKLRFIRSVQAEFICSQLPSDAAHWLYADCTDSRLLLMPHALNPKWYCSTSDHCRPIDIGFIGVLYDRLIGDMERTNLVRFFQNSGKDFGLHCDLRWERLPRPQWVQFLNACKGILGAESGTYFLDKTGEIFNAVHSYVRTHRSVSFDEVYEHFFKNHARPVSGKAVSSRHFEATGTKTCQLLIEGDYNGVLIPNEHYIPVSKDLKNIEEAIRQFKDDSYRIALVERTYDYILSAHTYQHRVEELIGTVRGVLP